MLKVHFVGTHRVRHPEETWDSIAPVLGDFGITRVADVTGLDRLDIPVAMAIRPLGRTLSVSQGKGGSLLLAKVSGAMEAIEMWHAECASPPTSAPRTPAVDLPLPYRFDHLQRNPGNLTTSRTPLDWVEARTLVDRRTTLVPRDCVVIDRVPDGSWWSPRIKPSGNGLASGNSFAEAVVHGLYELLERDAVSSAGGQHSCDGLILDLTTVDDPLCAGLIRRFRTAGAWLEVLAVENRWSTPCFIAYTWSEDYPLIGTGSGAHADPAVALSRALTEAAQSRLTSISGSRDDLDDRLYRMARYYVTRPPATRPPRITWPEVLSSNPGAVFDVEAEMAHLSERIEQETGSTPVSVDLSTCERFSVVKVIAAGLAFDGSNTGRRSAEVVTP